MFETAQFEGFRSRLKYATEAVADWTGFLYGFSSKLEKASIDTVSDTSPF